LDEQQAIAALARLRQYHLWVVAFEAGDLCPPFRAKVI
jgi:hypothetical protein